MTEQDKERAMPPCYAPLPAVWTVAEAWAAGYYISAPMIWSGGRDWKVWHRDHRDALCTTLPNRESALQYALLHELQRRMLEAARAAADEFASPLPAHWTNADGMAAGYFIRSPGHLCGEAFARSEWTVWHRDHREPIAVHISSPEDAWEAARQHEARRRLRESLNRRYGKHVPANPAANPAADQLIGAHYDAPPLAVGLVPQEPMEAARAYVAAAGVDPRWTQTSRLEAERLRERLNMDAVLLTAEAYSRVRWEARHRAGAFEVAAVLCRNANCPDYVVNLLQEQADAARSAFSDS